MKLSLVFLACMACVGISAAYVPGTTKPAVNKTILEMQMFLHKILIGMGKDTQFEEVYKIGKQLIVDQTKYEQYDETMKNFYHCYKMGSLLPKGEFFSAIQQVHIKQALGLFNFFFYAKDWEVFSQNVAWARLNVNEGMLIYALNLAVIHRPDMKDLTLPPIYEINPRMFFNAEFIQKTQTFNVDLFNKHIMYEKELGPINTNKYASKIFKERFYMKGWKVWQWWNLMGLDKGFHVEEQTLLRNNIADFQTDPKYKAVWDGVKAYYLPVDYTRDIGIFNQESKLSYFTEDIGLNTYWYYFNMYYANYLGGKQFHLDADRRGEKFLYNVQQLLARYYLERQSVRLYDIDDLSFYGTVKNGYDPQLIDFKGNGYTFRKDYYHILSYQNVKLFNKVTACTRRISDTIDSGKYVTKDGTVIDLVQPESVEIIGNLMQGNIDVIDKEFFGFWYPIVNILLSGGNFDSFIVQPHVLMNYETMLRDPITYLIFKKIVDKYYQLKTKLPAYTPEQVHMKNLKVYDVEMSKFATSFELVDHDVTTLLNNKMVFQDGTYVWNKSLFARQLRLDHEPFYFKIKVKSDVPQKVVVRIFLTPVFDGYGQHIDLFTNTQNFILLDKFVYDLTAGENVVVRNSKDINYYAPDYTTYTELYKYVMLAYEGKQEYPQEIVQRNYRFPDRLILPRGWVEGMPVRVIFYVAPYTGQTTDTVTQKSTTGETYIDDLPFDYPFDRKIENIYEFFGPNLLVKEAKIYHTEKYEKYYPNKYANFGTFDYTF